VRAALPAQPKRCAVPKTANCDKLALPARPKQRAESSISATGLFRSRTVRPYIGLPRRCGAAQIIGLPSGTSLLAADVFLSARSHLSAKMPLRSIPYPAAPRG